MLRAILTKDWGWKLFSVILAVFIWWTVHRILDGPKNAAVAATDSTLTYGNLPVSLVSASADVRNHRLLQPTVSVTVSGPPELIDKLQANQLHATVDLTNVNAVNSEKQRVEVSVPAGVTVISIKPETLGIIPPPVIQAN